MPFNLPALARSKSRRKAGITLRPIVPTRSQAVDLAAIIAPAWRIWAEGVDAIMAGYDPAPLGDGATTGHFAVVHDSPAQIETAINALAAEFLTRLIVEITPGLRRWTARIERWHRQKWASAVLAGTGVDLSTVLTSLPVEETVETFVARNVALARNVSEQAQARISDAVWRGYQTRTPAREVAREIRGHAEMGRARAVRIASDQSAKLSAALDTERMAEAGIDFAKWRSSHKQNFRPEHAARDGKVYDIRSGQRRGGDEVIPADDRPAMKPWCGCRFQAWIPSLQGDGE